MKPLAFIDQYIRMHHRIQEMKAMTVRHKLFPKKLKEFEEQIKVMNRLKQQIQRTN